MSATVPFERLAQFLVVPVKVGGRVDAKFIFDSGVGVNLLDRRLAEEMGVALDGRVHTGHRMSGQSIEAPLGTLARLQLGDHTWTEVTVSPLDLASLSPALASIGGFLSLGLFESSPLRVDYAAGTVEVLAEDGGTSQRAGTEVPMRVAREGPSRSGFVQLRLPDGRPAEVEVDTGSDVLILHDRYFDGLVRDPATAKSQRGQDETGKVYERRFAPVPGEVTLADAPSVLQSDPLAMFQQIIYDGLVGDAFLSRYTVTFDPGRGRLGFDRPVSDAT